MKLSKSELEKIIAEETVKEISSVMGDDGGMGTTDWTRVKGLGADPSSHPDKKEIVQKCWHKTKHLEQGEFVEAFNACMEQGILQAGLEEGIEYVDVEDADEPEAIVTGPDGDASPLARALARMDDLRSTMLKAAKEIEHGMPQEAYETLIRPLSVAPDSEYIESDLSEHQGALDESSGGSEAKEAELPK